MKYDIKIPALGESISQVTIGTILKPTGSSVVRDDELIELETDKLNQVLYAQGSGVVTITVKTGDIAKVGDVIGYIEEQQVKEVPKDEPKKVSEPKASIASVSKEAWIKELDTKPEHKPEIIPAKSQDVKKPLSSLKKSMAKRLLEASTTTAMPK